ncbi:DUF4129 domain-containing protein [Herpetosiphon giganteus]|uniref:DUF4129 domain-containing protein n=1 Tax=Herpetosiphon giganteus TaxID=2029754 RepID=UPI001957EB88|nr:DUF4129 domain-containing protein [Herpetosiphon giganteus]MBM7841834.1 hypothetical protein [Herpetosiphon giganteus]
MYRMWRILACLLLVSGVLAQPLIAQAQAPEVVSVNEYTQLLREAFTAAQRTDEIGLREASDKIVALKHIRTRSEDLIEVNHQWLKDALASTTPNLPIIRDRLAAMLEALTAGRESAPQDLETLKVILNTDPFDKLKPQDAPAPSNFNFLRWLFGEGLTSCFTVIAVVFVLGLILYIARTVQRSNVKIARRKDPAEEQKLTSVQAIERADKVAAEEANFRDAVRYLYLSTLLWLEERGMLRYDRTLTNREVLAAVPSNTPLHQRLAPVIQTFDRVWYGIAEVDQTTFDHYRQQVTSLREVR